MPYIYVRCAVAVIACIHALQCMHVRSVIATVLQYALYALQYIGTTSATLQPYAYRLTIRA